MNETRPAGTASDPLITDPVPVSAGTAIAIGAAGSAIVLAQATTRAWRRISLAQFRGLLLARIPLLAVVLLLTSAVSAASAFHFFPDDARALGGLLPVLGALAPFVFLARRPDEGTAPEARPSRTRFAGWLLQSPVNIVLLLPGVALAALCVWGMVKAKSWEVLALSFSIMVAVVTRSDPPLYFAWDGVGTRWQWGRLLPCPTREPSWRFVVGRVEYPDGDVEVNIDAMEVPQVDSIAMRGALIGETAVISDTTLAIELRAKGPHRAMPHFYEYVETVWPQIIHGIRMGTPDEGRQLDQSAASCFFLIIFVLKEALQDKVSIGADVWLLLAILRLRLTDIAFKYVSSSSFYSASMGSRLALWGGSLWSAMSGRVQGRSLVLNDDLVNELEASRRPRPEDVNESDEVDFMEEGALSDEEREGDMSIGEGDLEGDADGDGPHQGNREADESDVSGQQESQNKDGEDETTPNGTKSDHYTLQMFQALGRADRPPTQSDILEWTEWVFEVLEELYNAAILVSKQEGNLVGQKQVSDMENTFREWLGDDAEEELTNQICKVLNMEATLSKDDETETMRGAKRGDAPMKQVEEATVKVSAEEAWTYVMLAMARWHTVTVGRNGQEGISFESAGVDVAAGELNGRLKAQNMARKVMLGQVGLWAYVALGQTATALLTRG